MKLRKSGKKLLGIIYFFKCVTLFYLFIVIVSFFSQPEDSDQGVPKNYNPRHPDRVCSGSLPARAAGGVYRTARLPVEAAGECKPKLRLVDDRGSSRRITQFSNSPVQIKPLLADNLS